MGLHGIFDKKGSIVPGLCGILGYPMKTLLARALEARLPAALRFLRELVEINSYTLNREGVNANAARVVWQFSRLGFEEKFIPCEVENAGNHLILDSGGEGPVIACVSHLDTVFTAQEEISQNFQWRQEGSLVYGPGTYDIKGGTALLWMMLDALAEVDPDTFRRFRWVLLWNAAEEVLTPDFAQIAFSLLPRETRCALVFEGDNGSAAGRFGVLRGRKGMARFRVRVSGRGAHAGGSHQNGASAIHQLARTVNELEALTDYQREATVNVGYVTGGSVLNRVPHEAEAALEMRAYDPAVFRELCDRITGLQGEGAVRAVSDGYPTTVAIDPLGEIPPWSGGPETERLVEVWEAAGAEAGHPLEAGRRGGLSDGNYLAERFPVLDALGPQGGNAHASEYEPQKGKLPEFIDTASLVPKALINLLALQALAKEAPRMDKTAPIS